MAASRSLAKLPPVASSRWCLVLTCALLAHAAWGVSRLPGKVIARRLEQIGEHRDQGAAAFLFAANRLTGAEAIDWVRANTPPNTVIAWTGDVKGAMEFAPALLWPRLLVAEHALGKSAQYAGRRIAETTRDGRRGRMVLVATGASLRVEVR